jgi:hypothetical protein
MQGDPLHISKQYINMGCDPVENITYAFVKVERDSKRL